MRMLLIATTALVGVASLAMAATLPDRQTASAHGGLNTNEEFLCNYGFQLQTTFYSGLDYSSTYDRAATPVIGKGESVNEITVADSSTNSTTGEFLVSIYTSHLGKPATKLVSAYAWPTGCGRVHVPISSIKLESGKKYWIVQRALLPFDQSSGTNSFLWLYDKNRTHGALSQSGREFCSSGSCYSYPGPWTHIRGGVPFARVRESAKALELNHPPLSQGASDSSISPVVVPTLRGGHEGNIPRYPP